MYSNNCARATIAGTPRTAITHPYGCVLLAPPAVKGGGKGRECCVRTDKTALAPWGNVGENLFTDMGAAPDGQDSETGRAMRRTGEKVSRGDRARGAVLVE